MATVVWNGGGVAAVAEVKTLTVTAVAAGQTLGITINNKTVSFTAAGTDPAAAAAGLQQLLAASTIPEFAEVGWGVAGNVVTGTHNTPGTPWTAAYAGTATATLATTTPATGPNFADAAGNWSSGTLPAAGDDVVFERSGVSALYGLTQFAATSFASVTVRQSFTGTVGLPATNAGAGGTLVPGGGGGYAEYRPRFLQLGGDPAVTIGDGAGTGSPRINLQVGAGATTLNVLGTGPAADNPGSAVSLVNAGGGNTLNVVSGTVGVAVETGQAAGFASVRLSGGTVTLGAGTSVATVAHEAGTLDCAVAPSGALTMARTAGVCTYHGAGALTATVYGGTLVYLSAGALTLTANGAGAKVDLSQDPRAKPVATASTVTGGAVLYDPAGTVAAGSAATFDEPSLAKSTLGPGRKVTW